SPARPPGRRSDHSRRPSGKACSSTLGGAIRSCCDGAKPQRPRDRRPHRNEESGGVGPLGSLIGKAALVTGAGMGIGKGIALALAREGARVAVHYAGSKDGAEDTVRQIEEMGGTAALIRGDLRNVPDCERVVDTAI